MIPASENKPALAALRTNVVTAKAPRPRGARLTVVAAEATDSGGSVTKDCLLGWLDEIIASDRTGDGLDGAARSVGGNDTWLPEVTGSVGGI